MKSETMFARKTKSVFDKLIPQQVKFKKTIWPHRKKISILAIKFFSMPTKTTLHSGKRAPSNKGLVNWSILSSDPKKKHPQTAYGPAQEMPFEWIRGITTKYLRRADRRNIRPFRSWHASSLSGSTTLGKKKKIYATTRRKSQEAEVLRVLLFFFSPFFQEKKRKLLEVGCCETETYLHHGLFQYYITNVVIS